VRTLVLTHGITWSIVVVSAVFAAWLGASRLMSEPPLVLLEQAARVVVAPIFSAVYREDLKYVGDATRGYQIGEPDLPASSPLASWRKIERRIPEFRVLGGMDSGELPHEVPFVYEDANAQHLVEFRKSYHLQDIIKGSVDEYGAMLQLGAWLGTRWDHGTDEVPGGTDVCRPAEVVKAGEQGARFWCEIAARTAIQAATALGWPARLVTASRDGYTWEHAVAEFWSNQFAKWFVMDTDFNVVFESSGIPLSAFELSRQGEQLRASKQLNVRAIARPKKNLPLIDLLPLYSYIHLDMRNDWCSRPLRPESPAGGDLSTWWTSRPSLSHILTAKKRVDEPRTFNWSVNSVAIYALDAIRVSQARISVEIELTGYSPDFRAFQVSFDGVEWRQLDHPRYMLDVAPGEHVFRGRMVTLHQKPGPESKVRFHLSSKL
jgi:hypothetical protein